MWKFIKTNTLLIGGILLTIISLSIGVIKTKNWWDNQYLND